jgi:hypothetical protein
MGKSNSLPPAGHYNANYGNFQTELYAQIRQEAFWRGYWNKTVGSPQTSRTGFWSGSTSLLKSSCLMLLVEQEARRCESRLRLAVLSSALMFTNRRLQRRVHLQPSAAWPSTPNSGLPMLPALALS